MTKIIINIEPRLKRILNHVFNCYAKTIYAFLFTQMVKLLDEQRSLRRILNDVETTHPLSSPSEASTIPDLSAVGSGEWAESVCEEGVADQDGGDDKTEMMDALRSLRLEVQQQREAARREMNCAVKEVSTNKLHDKHSPLSVVHWPNAS